MNDAVQESTGPIQVALLDLPEMLREIVTAILVRDHGVVVSDEDAANVLIVGGVDDSLPDAGRRQLVRHPRGKVLAVDDGRVASAYELRIHRTPLGEISADRLLAELRRPPAI
jgi:hypothetical protein